MKNPSEGSAPDERPSFIAVAVRPNVVRRALAYALVVGAILIAINQGDALLAGEISVGRALKMILTALVPYCVSTASSGMSFRVETTSLTMLGSMRAVLRCCSMRKPKRSRSSIGGGS